MPELAVPLEVKGEVRGVINVDSDRENAFNADDELLLQELARQAVSVRENMARCWERMMRLQVAATDTLTVSTWGELSAPTPTFVTRVAADHRSLPSLAPPPLYHPPLA